MGTPSTRSQAGQRETPGCPWLPMWELQAFGRHRRMDGNGRNSVRICSIHLLMPVWGPRWALTKLFPWKTLPLNLLVPLCHFYFKCKEAKVQRVGDLAKLYFSQQHSQDMNLGCWDFSLNHRDKLFPRFCRAGQRQVPPGPMQVDKRQSGGKKETVSSVPWALCPLVKDRECSWSLP